MRIGIEAIKPKKSIFNSARFLSEFANALETVADGVKKDLDATVATWRTRVNWIKRLGIRGGSVTVYALGYGARIYRYVDEGTRPHTIAPKNRSRLKFQQSYSPKTSPGSLSSTSGGPSGGFVFLSRPVRHPGTKPRGFIKQVRKIWGENLQKEVQRAIKAAIP